MHRTLVDAHGRSCLHPCRAYAVACDALGEAGHGRFGYASAGQLVAPDVHQSVEEGSGGHHHASRVQFHAPYSLYSNGSSVFHDQLACLILPDVEVGGIVEHRAPLPDELAAVALCTWAPYSGSLRTVEHAELDRRGVGDMSHLAAHCVNLAHDLSLGYSAHCRVAAHLSYLVHVHGDETSLRPHVRRGYSRLATGVSAADNQYVVIEIHKS